MCGGVVSVADGFGQGGEDGGLDGELGFVA